MNKTLFALPLTVVVGFFSACNSDQRAYIETLQTPNTSAAYDIATDAGRPLSDRRPAAMMVEPLEQSRLKKFLMNRIPGGWYTTAQNDAYVLATIGDEGHALYFDNLHLPDTREDARSAAVLAHTSAAMIRNRLGTNALQVATDRLVALPEREKASLRLTPMERAQLQAALLDRIPGVWDENTGHDIALLAEFGDSEAAARLESIYVKPDFTDTSALTAAMVDAVKQIRQRLAAG